MIKYSIANEFSKTPGPRFKKEGNYSGQEFRDDYFINVFDTYSKKGEKILVDLDGGYGYFVSFLEEAFGGLARLRGSKIVLDTLVFKSEEEPSLIDDIRSYIVNASKQKEQQYAK